MLQGLFQQPSLISNSNSVTSDLDEEDYVSDEDYMAEFQ